MSAETQGGTPGQTPEETPGGTHGETPGRENPRGFRSQPFWLRVLLVVSLAALATGIVRCSFEATAPPPPVRMEAP